MRFWIKIQQFSYMSVYLIMLTEKYLPFCFDLNVATPVFSSLHQMPPQILQQMSEMAISTASYAAPAEQPMVSTMTVPPGTQQQVLMATPAQRQMDNSRQGRMWKPGDQCLAKYWHDHKVGTLYIAANCPVSCGEKFNSPSWLFFDSILFCHGFRECSLKMNDRCA